MGMKATHRVRDSHGDTVGFIINDNFYTDYYVKANIEYVDNLSIISNDIIRADKELPELNYKNDIINRLYAQKVRENPFVRDIQKELMLWKNNPTHKILQLEGSRQIGKTTELQKFAYKNYEYTIYVNMASDIYNFDSVVKNGASPFEFEKYCLRAGIPHFVNNKSTILIIDEIQQSTLVYNALRTIEDNIECDIIITGSYLGRFLAHIRNNDTQVFFSAGTIQQLKMNTMSFIEFCRTFNCEDTLKKISLYGDDSDEQYSKLLKLYDVYRQIGGYPAVVKEYKQSNDITQCHKVIESLLSIFKDESKNYFNNEVEVEVFDDIYDFRLSQMCEKHTGSDKDILNETSHIIDKRLKNIISIKEMRNAMTWLKYSGIIDTCNLAHDGKIKEKTSARKIFFKDCGIAAYLANNSGIDITSLNGILTETFVFNELSKLFDVDYTIRKVKNKLHYGTFGNYELDFMLLDTDNKVYGIEVKTTKGDPKSLKVFIDKKLVDKGIVAKRTKGGHGDKFDTIPIYTVGCRFPYH